MNKISSGLEKARKYERERLAAPEKYPVFHVTAPVGWINDPNGFSLYQGEYHLFYQYHPYDNHWGPMHWGHCKTVDFIRWDRLPCALAPDMDYDGQGCFSGSAIEHEGKHILMYTGVKETEKQDGTRETFQTQSIAIGDGISYEKLEENPVICTDLLPEGSVKADFRDPKIWWEKGNFYAAVGGMDQKEGGQILLFSSRNIVEWKLECVLDRNQNRYGTMWECPDFFDLNGRKILLVSAVAMQAEKTEFHNGNNSIYFVGTCDEEKTFRRGEAHEIDCGLDFYAPQTLETEDGRRIMIGWMHSWDNDLTPDGTAWNGMMTIPRELGLKGDRLIQNPVRELENYRRNKVVYRDVVLTCDDGERELYGINGRILDMTVEIQKGNYREFQISLAANQKNCTLLVHDKDRGMLRLDRTWSGMTHDLTAVRTIPWEKQDESKMKFRILMDRFSVEIFVNDGELAMSTVIYTDLSAQGIYFSCDGTAEFSVIKYDVDVPSPEYKI